jgi:hydrogenase maturation protease
MKSIAEQVADAALYEGYILYPYRPSSLKNRQRWNFGGICPRSYSEAQNGTELWRSQMQMLVSGSPDSALSIKLRFLHLVAREVVQIDHPVSDIAECSDSDFRLVPSLKIGDRLFQTWQEAVEREVEVPELALQACQDAEVAFPLAFPASRCLEALRDKGQIIGALIRTQQQVHGGINISCERIRDGLFRVTVAVLNLTDLPNAGLARDQAMMHSLASSHLIVSIRDGEFISLLAPPADFADASRECHNIGLFPVLVGAEGERTTMMASPVILYDYPAIAPESAGDLFDGTEIDEILTLRILALTDAEKSELRQSDERARRILDRIEANPEQLMKLHGAVRSMASTQSQEGDTP